MKLDMMNNEYKGKLITFSGLNGSGKTTQIKKLKKWLKRNGHKVFLTKQPTDFLNITQKLDEGFIVISEHYFYSYLVKLTAQNQESRICEAAKYFVKPDASFFMNLPVDMAMERAVAGLKKEKQTIDPALQKKMHDLYVEIARENGGIIVSTILPEEICFQRILLEVDKLLSEGE